MSIFVIFSLTWIIIYIDQLTNNLFFTTSWWWNLHQQIDNPIILKSDHSHFKTGCDRKYKKWEKRWTSFGWKEIWWKRGKKVAKFWMERNLTEKRQKSGKVLDGKEIWCKRGKKKCQSFGWKEIWQKEVKKWQSFGWKEILRKIGKNVSNFCMETNFTEKRQKSGKVGHSRRRMTLTL